MSPESGDVALPAKLVVDASVGIKLCVDEPLCEKARGLFEPPAAGPWTRFLVPDLFYAECANILWKYVRRAGYLVSQARQDMADMMRLEVESSPIAELAEDALPIALAHEISAYDACYVALSRRENVPLVTADERLVRKLEGARGEVKWLGDLPAGPTAAG